MILRLSNRALLGCIALSLLAAGCGGGGDALPKANVTGVVTMDGEPVTGVAVRFSSSSVGGGAFNVGEDGTFASPSPITVGDYQVSIDRPGANPGNSPSEMSFPKDESGKIPAAYKSQASSGLTATVTEDEDANHFEFALSSDKAGGPKNSNRAPKGPEPMIPEAAE